MAVERLTERRIKTVRAAQKPVELRDALVRGLELRVMPSGSKSWALRYRRPSDRKKRTLSLGAYPALSLDAARKRAHQQQVDIAHGSDPVGELKSYRSAPTFKDVASDWLAWKRQQGRSAGYLKRSAERLAKDVYPIIGEVKACEVSKRQVAAIIERVGQRGALTEANRFRALLHAILGWASGTGRIEANPAAGLPRPFEEKPRERVLSEDEIRAIWAGLDAAPGEAASKIAMHLCLVLGQRPKEIVHLAKEHLSLDAPMPTMLVVSSEAKNRETHIVPLTDFAVKLFREALVLARDATWVFPAPGGRGPLAPHALTHIVSRAKRKSGGTFLGVSDVRLYDFRRTVATGLGEMGFPDEMIGRLLNHRGAKSRSITSKHYNHALYLRERLELLQAWERRLRGVLGLLPDVEPKATGRIQLVPSSDEETRPDVLAASESRGAC
jgi:integrase